MKLKRVLALICAAVLALGLFAGCGAKEESVTEAPDVTTAQTNGKADLQLIQPGKLIVGTEIGYPPFEMYAEGNVPTGFDIELAKEIAAILGLEVEYKDRPFDTILQGLEIDQYDVVMSAVTITGERKAIVDFSDSYVKNWQSIVVLKGTTPITSPEGLNGKKVTYQKGTTSTKYLTDLIDTGKLQCEVTAYDKVLQCFDALRNGTVDAVLCDSVVTDGYIVREPNKFDMSWIQSSDAAAEPELFGVAVKKGNASLLAAVNDALAQLEENKTLEQLREDWNLQNS